MPHNLGTDENPIPVFVRVSGGFVDAIVRAPDLATFEAAAKTAELMVEITEAVTDEETGETTTQGTGEWKLSKGVHFDHLGPVMLTPGTYDEDGNEITAPTFDNRHHVNIRMASPSTEMRDGEGVLKWHKWAIAWTANGTPDANTNASEQAKVLLNVALIDPDSIASPSRVWL